MNAVDWKADATSLNWLLETPTFRALTWVECPDSRRLAFVKPGGDQADVSRLRDHEVIIDGARYRCLDVRTCTPGPHREGDSIGILVADVRPAPSGSG
jgi:hypothetical protein